VTPASLAHDLRIAVEAGDAERARDLVVQATEKERRLAAKEIGDRHWSLRASWNRKEDAKRRAAVVAWLGTATARQVAGDWWSLEHGSVDRRERALLHEVLAARGRAFAETVARNAVDDGVQRMWPLVRVAVQEGLIDRPEDDVYVRGMVNSLAWNTPQVGATYDALLADPELLEIDLWRLFEVDCSSELSNATGWETDEKGAYAGRGENRWEWALVRLAAEERIDRQRLLDASLGTLLRDFRPSMVGWYAKLHEALEPTDEERRLRIDTYLSLLASPAPAAIKEGLTGLRAVEAAVPVDDLARAAAGPLTQKQKNLAVDMLRLLAQAAKREPNGRPALLEAAALGLGHERADVQERALALLERYPDEAPRAALLGLADTVAAQLRPRAHALTGIAAEPVPVPVQRPVAPPAAPAPTPLAPLAPVESVDELIELAGFLLEGQGTGDDVERLLDGVSRLCDQRPQGFERRVAGLRKRVEDVSWWQFGSSAADSVGVVVRAWVTGRRTRGLKPVETLLGFLAERALEVAARAARRSPRPLLAFPTHAGGRIDPQVLVERERGFGRLLNRPEPADLLQARVRALEAVEPIRYERRLVDRRKWGHPVQLRPDRPLAELGRLGTRAAAAGSPSPRSIWLEPAPWGSWDALGARWCLTVAPSLPEIAFAGAAILIVDSLDTSPQFHPDAALEHALDPSVPLAEPAWLAVAAALVAKSPDLRRVATDVLVTSIADGRFDPDAAGDASAWLANEGLAKVSRLAEPLRDAGRVSALHATEILRLVEALLARLTATPHGLHAPLEVAVEHASSLGWAVENADARATLERIVGEVSPSSKLGRLARQLLDLSRTT
jgi:Family of unknown function (DUF6493)